MIARTLRVQVSVDRIDGVLEAYREDVRPIHARAAGLRQHYVLVDRRSGWIEVTGVWDSADDLARIAPELEPARKRLVGAVRDEPTGRGVRGGRRASLTLGATGDAAYVPLPVRIPQGSLPADTTHHRIGLKDGEIDDSRLRVIRLLAIMTAGGDAFDDRLNKFNRSMNRGYRLSKWFAGEFGSTQCRKITGCDFSDSKGVSDYIDGDQLAKCKAIGCQVAEKVRSLLASGSEEWGAPAPTAATST